jgi:phosphoribosylglycinamide formyltransferase-1
MKMLRLGILGSTRGTDMLALIAAINQNLLSASIELVVSNKENALILERARAHNIRAEFIDPVDLTRAAYDDLLSEALTAQKIDLVVLIGYMRILSPSFVAQWRNKIINVHPSLLPEFSGGMNKDVHQAVLNAAKKTTGCTIHYVTEDIDKGPILIQKSCMVLPTDTVETLQARVQELEGIALIEAIDSIASEFSF